MYTTGKILHTYYKNTAVGKSTFTIVNTQNTEFILKLFVLIIVLLICITTVNLLLPSPGLERFQMRIDLNVNIAVSIAMF